MQEYIVYMGDRPTGKFSATSFHTSMLHQVLGRLFNLNFRAFKYNTTPKNINVYSTFKWSSREHAL